MTSKHLKTIVSSIFFLIKRDATGYNPELGTRVPLPFISLYLESRPQHPKLITTPRRSPISVSLCALTSFPFGISFFCRRRRLEMETGRGCVRQGRTARHHRVARRGYFCGGRLIQGEDSFPCSDGAGATLRHGKRSGRRWTVFER